MAGIHIIKKTNNATQTKFDWQASESGPFHYPVQITTGTFYSPNGDSLYVPNGVTLHNGWGDGRSSHVVGEELKSLPDRLVIAFISYSENQFYHGEFKLPYQKILALFQAGHYSHKVNKQITYHRITVGVAPGGAVSVWLTSLDKTTGVFFGYANKEEGNWKSINNNPKLTREEYIQRRINESLEAEMLSPEAITALKQNEIPFDLWENYHKNRYHWQAQFSNMPILYNRIVYIKYFNGEHGYVDLPDKETNIDTTRAVPSEMIFIWDRPQGEPLRIKLFFDEAEIFAAFKRLGDKNLPLQFEMRMQIKGEAQNFSIWLKNEKESIVIKQTNVETFGIP